mgnify:CR=1 FL=1
MDDGMIGELGLEREGERGDSSCSYCAIASRSIAALIQRNDLMPNLHLSDSSAQVQLAQSARSRFGREVGEGRFDGVGESSGLLDER